MTKRKIQDLIKKDLFNFQNLRVLDEGNFSTIVIIWRNKTRPTKVDRIKKSYGILVDMAVEKYQEWVNEVTKKDDYGIDR